ncbi:MAG: ATP-binding protein [Thermoguttaceae bacterium]|jgi:AAA15 family ATPase/GTPase
MLIEFRVENHRSLRDEQVLTMEAGRIGNESDPRPRQIPGHLESLLTVAGLYGANASGKSNVLAALAFMCEAVVMSHRFWSPDEGEPREPFVPRDPFAWGSKRKDPSLFEVTFLLDSVQFQYGFKASDECFLEEWLYAWPNGKKQVWYERDNNTFKFGENLKGENKLIEEVTRPNALFLSAAAQHKHPQLASIFSWFRSFQAINLSRTRYRSLPFWMSSEIALARLFDEDTEQQQTLSPMEELSKPIRERFRNLLKKADDSIVDLRVEGSKPDDKRRRIGPIFFLKHQSESEDAWLPLKEESHGTQTMFHIALPILEVLQEGGIILVDELERSLHPSLARQIVLQFNDPAANPKNAQIIFTTHDTNLLGTTVGEPALRRDQVWLTEKDPEGATVLYPLTDYKPRKAENLERGYLQGRYGAIPFLGDFLVVGE